MVDVNPRKLLLTTSWNALQRPLRSRAKKSVGGGYLCMYVCMYVCRYAAIYSHLCVCVCACARASRHSCGQIECTFVSPPCIKLTIKASNSWTCSRTWSNHRKRTIEKILTLRALFFFDIRLCCSAFLDGPALSNGQGDRATVLSMLSPTSFVAALSLHSGFAPYTLTALVRSGLVAPCRQSDSHPPSQHGTWPHTLQHGSPACLARS